MLKFKHLFIGISFCGADIGGFWGDPEEELFMRWNQAAAFQPFFRNHASKGTKHREPWMWSEKALNISRDAIKKRYQFLPMWYTLFYEHEISGIPVMRPMLSQYPRDKNVLEIETQFMLADKLLVSPVLERGATWVLVYFPSTDGASGGDLWYDIDTYQKYDTVGRVPIEAKIDKSPVFQRGGTIIPKKLEARSSSVKMRDDPFSLYVALDKEEMAEGTLYYDDETSFDYRENNIFDYIHFQFNISELEAHPMMENYEKIKFDKIFIAGMKSTPNSATFMCRSTNTTTQIANIQVDSEHLLHVDIAAMECDYSWTLKLNGSGRSILGGSLIIFAAIVHVLTYFM